MNASIKLFLRWACLAVVCLASHVTYGEVAVTPSDYSGSRTKSLLVNPSGGLVSNGGLGGILSYSMSWSITDLGGGSFSYTYNLPTIAGLVSTNTSFFLELGTGLSSVDFSNVMINGSPIGNFLGGMTYTDATVNGDTGVLFANSTLSNISSITFTMNAAPQWGDFLHGSVLGLLGNVTNVGFGITPTLGDSPFTNWIATPGVSTAAVPEPETYAILGSLLLVAMLVKRRRLSTTKS